MAYCIKRKNVDNSTQETALQLTENTVYDSVRLSPKRYINSLSTTKITIYIRY